MSYAIVVRWCHRTIRHNVGRSIYNCR